MDKVLSIFPDEILIMILSLMVDEDLKRLSNLSPRIQKLQNDPQLWLAIIRQKFDIDLSNQKAYSLLIDLMNNEMIKKVDVVLANINNKTYKVLGRILISATDTLGKLVCQIWREYGLLGWIEFSQDIGGDEYMGHFITYESYKKSDYIYTNFETLIIPKKFRPDLKDKDSIKYLNFWLDNTIKEIMPKPLLMDLVIMIHDYTYTDRDRKIIESALSRYKC